MTWKANAYYYSTTSRVTITVTSTTPQIDNAPYLNPSQLHEVAEICSYLQKRTNPVVGFCFDDSYKLHAYPGESAQVCQATQGVTLAQVLPQLSQRLKNGDMYQLAVILTATVLQLMETPWLDGSWNKNGIFFTRTCSDITGNVDIKYPSLVADFVPGMYMDLPLY
jgi:hypothetical protein